MRRSNMKNLAAQYKLAIMVLSFLLMIGFALPQEKKVSAETQGTIIEGAEIDTDTTWGIEGSPYHIRGEVRIDSGKKWTIEPGVEIIGEKNGNMEGFVVSNGGHIVAKGTPEQPITFQNIGIGHNQYGTTVQADHVIFDHSSVSFDMGQSSFTNSGFLTSDLAPGNDGTVLVEKNVFQSDSTIVLLSGGATIRHNTFSNNLKKPVITAWDFSQDAVTIEENHFLDVGKPSIAIAETCDPKNITHYNALEAGSNYFGTNNLNVIDSMIVDHRDQGAICAYVDYLSPYEKPIQDVPSFAVMTTKVTDYSEWVSGKLYVPSISYHIRIDVVLPTGTYTGGADANGNFDIWFPKQKAGSIAKVYVHSDDPDASYERSYGSSFAIEVGAPLKAPVVQTLREHVDGIKGTAEPGSTITLQSGNLRWKTTTKPDGTFFFNMGWSREGTVYKLYAEDRSRNKSATTIAVVKDGTPPAAPFINPITTKTTAVYGNTEKYATVTVRYGTKKIVVKANRFGAWVVKFPAQKKGTVFTFNVTDVSGNISKTTTVKITR